ncbi:DUF4327 family protein [Lyngbya confervoides]|uniref:DUF4327 family protein n=1 Tax=Lyngbya confervoides BDU141951 TaxID=1574623 RepID=A0ABD4T739_9CYAN|nr:DUF4327 family protein [Lyngbya confervoides]MCM1984300.1 DUF4327 family protein [Lyngbya confervoides BDU141951]
MPKVRQRTIDEIQDEVRALVMRGRVGRQQRIYELSRHFSIRDWPKVERLLADHDYLLRDAVIDLVGHEVWLND